MDGWKPDMKDDKIMDRWGMYKWMQLQWVEDG